MRQSLILFLLFVTNAHFVSAQSSIFQLTNPESVKLLDEVALLYKKPVIAVDARLAENVSALAEIAIDGTPVIKVPTGRDPSEADLVHELFHLKLIAEGFGFIRFTKALPAAVETRLYQWVKDPIQHTIFFPRMKEMGFNPSEQIERIASSSQSGFVVQSAQPRDLSLVPLFALQMALRDNTALFDKFVEGKVDKDDIAVSRQAVAIVVKDNPRTPSEEAATVVKVLNCLIPSVGTFSFGRWEQQRKGAVVIKTAIIEVGTPEPQRFCVQ